MQKDDDEVKSFKRELLDKKKLINADEYEKRILKQQRIMEKFKEKQEIVDLLFCQYIDVYVKGKMNKEFLERCKPICQIEYDDLLDYMKSGLNNNRSNSFLKCFFPFNNHAPCFPTCHLTEEEKFLLSHERSDDFIQYCFMLINSKYGNEFNVSLSSFSDNILCFYLR